MVSQRAGPMEQNSHKGALTGGIVQERPLLGQLSKLLVQDRGSLETVFRA